MRCTLQLYDGQYINLCIRRGRVYYNCMIVGILIYTLGGKKYITSV